LILTSRKAISPSVVKADKLNSPDTPVNSASKVTKAALSKKELIANAKRLSKQYRVSSDKKFKLKDFPTIESPSVTKLNKPLAQDTLQQGVQLLAQMQDKLYAQDKWSLLVIFQAMDAAGKDGAIKHVMSGINPQGCEVTAFKAPTSEELDHDYLWRCMKRLPERGRIGIFNRSYYEEVLVVRVHEGILQGQKLPEKLVNDSIWDDRLNDIRNFESYLNRNGILVVKIFLNISKKEQKKRFIERIDTPEKNWKFSAGDVEERKYWKQYMAAYEEMIKKTASEKSPWYVVPADDKPYARVIIASAIIQALDSMKLAYPTITQEQVAELQRLKQELLTEK
jgi:PPK2 family polyphosphate:nucleotide phosphotransferase